MDFPKTEICNCVDKWAEPIYVHDLSLIVELGPNVHVDPNADEEISLQSLMTIGAFVLDLLQDERRGRGSTPPEARPLMTTV